MKLYETLNAARNIFANCPTGSAYVEYIEDMGHVLDEDQTFAMMELERVCLGDGAMEARKFILEHLRECRECEGQGYVANCCHYASNDYDERTCPTCDGTRQHLTSPEIAELYKEAHALLEEWHETE